MSSRYHRLTFYVLAGLLCALMLTAVGAPSSFAKGSSARVVNGTTVTQAQFSARWQSIAILTARGEVDTRTGQFCAGTFVAKDLVVTAAHCVSDISKVIIFEDTNMTRYLNTQYTVRPRTLQVVGGRRVLSARTGDRVDVQTILIHRLYSPVNGFWDAALLKLARPVSDTSGVTPISPVAEGEDAATWGGGAGLAATPARGPWLAGWGWRVMPDETILKGGLDQAMTHRPSTPQLYPTASTLARQASASKLGRTPANTLEEALVPIQSDARCENGTAGTPEFGYGRMYDAQSMLCAGTLNSSDFNDLNSVSNGIDACFGDSGGPLIASNGSELRLIGIVSGGIGCAIRRAVGVYAKVSAFRNFVLNIPPRRNVENARAPRLNGPAHVGAVLRCNSGRWMGAGKVRTSVRWVESESDSDFDFSEIAGMVSRIEKSSTRRQYVVRASNRGKSVHCLEMATNGQTSAAALSNPVEIDSGGMIPALPLPAGSSSAMG